MYVSRYAMLFILVILSLLLRHAHICHVRSWAYQACTVQFYGGWGRNTQPPSHLEVPLYTSLLSIGCFLRTIDSASQCWYETCGTRKCSRSAQIISKLATCRMNCIYDTCQFCWMGCMISALLRLCLQTFHCLVVALCIRNGVVGTETNRQWWVASMAQNSCNTKKKPWFLVKTQPEQSVI